MIQATRLLMGMPITVAIADAAATAAHLAQVYAYFTAVDARFSTYKETSEISRINRGEIARAEYSPEMREVLLLAEQTKRETQSYFDIRRGDMLDPSGIVKGWAIYQAAQLVQGWGFRDYYLDAGGDIQVGGRTAGRPWRVGIRNPFNRHEHVKVLALTDMGVATSGTAIRGQHIYDPHRPDAPITDIVSLTVLGPNVYEADRFATAAFAMGRRGIQFIERLAGCEGYLIDANARATLTSGFEEYTLRDADLH
jgi:thiamine biosynthesis lipoprotein